MKRSTLRFQKKSNSFIYLSVLLLFFLSSTTLFAAEDNFTVEPYKNTYYVTSSGGLNIRRGPSTQYDIIGSLPYGAQVTVTGKVTEYWFEISYHGENGYISSKYVSPEPIITNTLEIEDMMEEPETFIEPDFIPQNYSHLFSDSTVFLLFLAIIATIVTMILTLVSIFRTPHPYDSENTYDGNHKQL